MRPLVPLYSPPLIGKENSWRDVLPRCATMQWGTPLRPERSIVENAQEVDGLHALAQGGQGFGHAVRWRAHASSPFWGWKSQS